MKNQNTWGIHFGCLHPSIGEQLQKQKLNYSNEKSIHFENLRQSIINLMLNNILNDTQVKKAYNKLFTQIKRHVNIENKALKS